MWRAEGSLYEILAYVFVPVNLCAKQTRRNTSKNTSA